MNSTLSQVAGGSADRPSWADFDIMAIPCRNRSRGGRGRDGRAQRRRIRAAALLQPRDGAAERSRSTPTSGTSRPSTWSAPGTSSPAPSSSIIVAVLDSGMAFRTATIRYNSRFAFRLTPCGPLYPALGVVDVPFAAAPELGSGSTRSSRRATSSGTTTTPVDLDGHGTHVAGTIGQLTNNNSRHRRHGLQRAPHAGEGDRRRSGTTSSAAPTTAPTMWSRAACATPPTTARRSST